MGNKLYIISDAHLGAGDDSPQRERQLCQLLDTMAADAAMIVFLGDMFDFWFTYRHVVPRGHVRLLGCLARLADAGIPLHYFVGNHDMWLFDYLHNEMGVIMHNDPCVIPYDGKRFLMGHGDGLGHTDRPYDLLRRVFRSRLCQRLFAILPPWATFGLATRWSRSSRRSHQRQNPNILPYMGDHREGIVIHCRQRLMEEPIDYCLFGHRHTPLTRTLTADNGRQSLYVNVGDWLTHRTYAVYADGQLTLRDASTSAQ